MRTKSFGRDGPDYMGEFSMIKKLPALFFFLINANAVYAGSSSGPVGALLISPNGVLIFDTGPHPSKPSCGTAGSEWALSIESSAGKAVYALLLAAKAQNQIVNVVGKNDCSYWYDREAPDYIYVN
jgi:hypothetical protein